MTANQELKARARRARSAVGDIFGISCSESQSFKLMARIENFPSWEAAGASYRSSAENTIVVPATPMADSKSAARMPHRSFADHTLVVGPSGSGLSTVVNTYLRQVVRDHNARLYAFDDRDGRDEFAFVADAGGDVIDIGEVEFYPLQHVGDEAERAWAADWIETIVRQDGSVLKQSRAAIASALKALAAPDIECRSMTMLGVLAKDKAVKDALAIFCHGLGEAFDATSEQVGKARMQVFAMGKLMQERRFLLPTILYLIHRIMRIAADGEPTVIALDLRRLLGEDEWLAERVSEWLAQVRKANVAIVFVESDPRGFADNPVAKVILSACLTKVFLPNPELADADALATYKAAGLSFSEIRCIETAMLRREYCSKARGGFLAASLNPGPDARIECKSVAEGKPETVKADVGVRLMTAWDAEDATRAGQRLVDPAGSSKDDPFVVAAGLLVAAALLHVGYAAIDRNESGADVGGMAAAAQLLADPAFDDHRQMLMFMRHAEHEAGAGLGWRDSSGKPTKQHPAVIELTSMLVKQGDAMLAGVVMVAYGRLKAAAAKQ